MRSWYPIIPDNIRRAVSHFKIVLSYFGSPSMLKVLQVETAMPGFLRSHYGAIRKTSFANKRLSCHSTFSICRASWNLPPSVSLFCLLSLSSLSLPTVSSLVCIDLWLRVLEIWGTVIRLAVTAGRCEEQTSPKTNPKTNLGLVCVRVQANTWPVWWRKQTRQTCFAWTPAVVVIRVSWSLIN